MMVKQQSKCDLEHVLPLEQLVKVEAEMFRAGYRGTTVADATMYHLVGPENYDTLINAAFTHAYLKSIYLGFPLFGEAFRETCVQSRRASFEAVWDVIYQSKGQQVQSIEPFSEEQIQAGIVERYSGLRSERIKKGLLPP